MNQLVKKNELHVGMRIKLYAENIIVSPLQITEKHLYKGVVMFCSDDSATIKRDDGYTGSGRKIKEAPYNGANGWIIHPRTDMDCWGGSAQDGYLFHDKINWKSVIER